MSPDIRWQQRLESFTRALTLLREPLVRGEATLSDLEKEGTIQRFEFTLELAWKTVKDYLQHEGRELQPVTARNVMKEAFAAGIVQDGQVWIEMIDHRNMLSHTYDKAAFDTAVKAIAARYFPAMEELRDWLAGKAQ